MPFSPLVRRFLAAFAAAFALVASSSPVRAQGDTEAERVRARVVRVFVGTNAVVGRPVVTGALARVPYVLRDPQETSGADDGVNSGVALVVRYPFGWQVYRLISAACAHPRHVLSPRDVRDCDTKLRDEGPPQDVSAIRGVIERSGALVVANVRIVDGYALANVGSFGVGGERALARENDGWVEIGGATDVASACGLVGYGVPPATAVKLMERAYWPDPAPGGAHALAACS
jgi:hypothetical protein